VLELIFGRRLLRSLKESAAVPLQDRLVTGNQTDRLVQHISP
jgi:hypothetical protein